MADSADVVAGGGWLQRVGTATSTGREMAAHDWSQTAAGPPDSWPVELQMAVRICLSTRFPMMILWGPDLLMIYNDGYRSMIGAKHPAAVGAPFRKVWVEISDVIGPLVQHVAETAQPTWSEHQQLLIDRNGFLEETEFTFSYSPLLGTADEVVGIIDIATETTAEVFAGRRLRCLSDLSAALVDTEQVTDACVAAAASLARWPADIIHADVFLSVGGEPLLMSTTRQSGRTPIDAQVLVDVIGDSSFRVLGATNREVPTPVAGIVLPLGSEHTGSQGALFIETSPIIGFDAAYREFLHTIAGTIAIALDNALRRASELGEHRRISDTLQAAMLRPASDHPTVAARYQPAGLNLAVGGDWYDVIDLDEHRRAMVVGDCVGHGLEAATTMGQLRSAARALLLEGHGPSVVLEQLDVFSAATPGGFATTVVCVVVDRARATVTYSRAGHPPPLIVGPEGDVRWLDGAVGVPLEVRPGVIRPEETIGYTDGSLLVLYSDGLIERRGESLDVGFARLEEVARECVLRDVHEIADELLRRLITSAQKDDVVLVAKRLPIDPVDPALD